MKNDCLFCAIVAGEIPGTKVYEDSLCYAFRDINPQAPTHILVVPKEHIASVAEINDDIALLAGRCLAACAKIAVQEGLTEGGYRIVSNCGDNAGQSVHHLHFHILGGTKLSNQMA